MRQRGPRVAGVSVAVGRSTWRSLQSDGLALRLADPIPAALKALESELAA